jgi:hypothetical protein
MKNNPLFILVAAATVGGLLTTFAGAAHASDGTVITRTGTYTTSTGGSGTMSSVTDRSQGVVSRQGRWTNASGAKGSWQTQTTWNPSNHTAAISGSATNPKGGTRSWTATAERTAPGTFTEKGTFTTPDGKTGSFTATRTKISGGSWDKQEVITTADGKTINRDVRTSVANGSGTRTVTTNLPDGRTVTRNVSFTQTVSNSPEAAPTP